MAETKSYTIAEGDTFYNLARRLEITVQDLQALNPNVDYTKLVSGVTKIEIPDKTPNAPEINTVEIKKTAAVAEQPEAPKIHRVVSGDTLSGLSVKYGLPVAQIKELNSLENDVIRLGEDLIVGGSPQAVQPAVQPAPTAKPALSNEALVAAQQAGQSLFISTKSAGNDGKAFLTFDDGPARATTPRILDILKDSGHKATFFVQGINIAGNEDILKRIVNEGHEVAIHSWNHTSYNTQSNAQIQGDLTKTAELIHKTTGV